MHILLYIKLSIKAIEKRLLFQHFTQIFLYLEVFFILEPFGLLNFLQTALSSANFNQNSTTQKDENQENSTPFSTVENTNPSSEEERKNASYVEKNYNAQNAFTQFMSSHDARVKKTRK